MARLSRAIRRERGASALEYILVLALVGLVVVALVGSGLRARSAAAVQTAVCNLFSTAGCGADVAGGADQPGGHGADQPGADHPGGGDGDGGGFWGGVRDAGGAFVDGLIRGDFNRDDRTNNGWTETARGVGQFLSGVLVVGDVRDGGAAIGEIWSSGGRDGWGSLLLSGVGLIPLAGDAIKGVSRGARVIDDVAGAADDVPRPRAPDDPPAPGRPPTCLTNSFAPATRVLLADGTTVPIAEVDVGDEVLAADPTTGAVSARAVTGLIVGLGVKALVDVTVGGATITATDGHPFYLPEADGWVAAADLRPGDALLTDTGRRVQVDAVRDRRVVSMAHNLTVDDLHTYHVLAGTTPILVHNASPCTPAERVDALRANPNLTGQEHLADIQRRAEAGDAGATGELDGIERSLAQGRQVEVLPPRENQGVRTPDLRIDGQLTDIKTRDIALNSRWIKDEIADISDQVRSSRLPGSNAGAAELQLRGPAAAATDEQISRQVLGAFNADRGTALSRVSVYRDGQLAGEWLRNADGTVSQVFPRR